MERKTRHQADNTRMFELGRRDARASVVSLNVAINLQQRVVAALNGGALMALSALDDKAHHPEPADLARVLGSSSRLWDRFVSEITSRYRPVEAEWNFAGPKYGWSLRLKRKDRVIVYLIPQESRMLVGFALGEKAVAAALGAEIPAPLRNLIEAAPRYAEGRGIRVPVASDADLDAALVLAEAKAAH